MNMKVQQCTPGYVCLDVIKYCRCDVVLFQNDAVMYQEPESQVVSRSGDECVVALCDQW